MESDKAYIQSLEKSLERQHNEKMELLKAIETQARTIGQLNYYIEDARRRETYNRECELAKRQDWHSQANIRDNFGYPIPLTNSGFEPSKSVEKHKGYII